ncbi:anther-specific protein LAT52-like [Corylus avellana]|uniref:anther-specific protein LAT52-like n=2 Tax=Corylus avellana TaxID=13451 RepID=UPI00286CFB52|nr:anther-specific protein LAT52-like [Corylus avellana]
MAQALAVAALFATIFCLSISPSLAHNSDTFSVEGKVYCDTCQVMFETKISEPIAGATVRLECRKRFGGGLTFSVEGVTDKNGNYSLHVEGDHEEEICTLLPIKSSRPDCNEQMANYGKIVVSLTSNSGVSSNVRYANPLGFTIKEALPDCVKVLTDMGFFPSHD